MLRDADREKNVEEFDYFAKKQPSNRQLPTDIIHVFVSVQFGLIFPPFPLKKGQKGQR